MVVTNIELIAGIRLTFQRVGRDFLFVILCLILCLVFGLIFMGPGQVMAEEPEHNEELPVMSDSELNTEGSASRKPSKDKVVPNGGDIKQGNQIKGKRVETPDDASVKKHSLAIGVGRMFGTLEHKTGAVTNISGGGTVIFNPSVKTELPLDTYMLSISDTITFNQKWEARLSLKKSLGGVWRETGTAEAWERGIFYSQISWWPDPNSLDIKWEADSELDALSIELNVRYKILTYSGFSLSAGLGYIREQLNFDVDDMVYYTPALDDFLGVDSGAQPVPRMLRQFSFTYDIPYLEIITAYKLNDRIGFSANIGYAPYITNENTSTPMPIDDSFDGYLHSDGKSDGNAIMVAVEGEYHFYENWAMNLKTEYVKTDTSGSESRYFSGLWYLDIDQDVESEEIYISLEAAYEF